MIDDDYDRRLLSYWSNVKQGGKVDNEWLHNLREHAEDEQPDYANHKHGCLYPGFIPLPGFTFLGHYEDSQRTHGGDQQTEQS